jgi:hypothetical protein
MTRRSLALVTVIGAAGALALGAVTIAVAFGGHPDIACPHISRSKAIDSVIGKARGYSARARLTTLREFESADPAVGHGSEPPRTRVWVIAISGRMPNFAVGPAPGSPKPPLNWMVVVSDASTGSMMLREGGFVGSWPPYFDQLPDRAWFCLG